MTELYWPGQDYPDREVWLAKRYTPSPFRHASLYYDPFKIVAQGSKGRLVRQGAFNPGVNRFKRAARAQRAQFRIVARRLGQPLFTIMQEDGTPSLYRQLMDLRRKSQRQGHVTIDKNLGGAPA